jgi:hypothetical protein
MGKQQMSKRSRKARKQAKSAELPRNLGHPSHTSLKKRRIGKRNGPSDKPYKVFSSDELQQAKGA